MPANHSLAEHATAFDSGDTEVAEHASDSSEVGKTVRTGTVELTPGAAASTAPTASEAVGAIDDDQGFVPVWSYSSSSSPEEDPTGQDDGLDGAKRMRMGMPGTSRGSDPAGTSRGSDPAGDDSAAVTRTKVRPQTIIDEALACLDEPNLQLNQFRIP